MSIQLYANKGLRGLDNMGNTCFANSCMQILSNTYELNDALNKHIARNRTANVQSNTILVHWNQLREQIWSDSNAPSRKSVSPATFIKCLYQTAKDTHMEMFQTNAQNDMGELMIFLLDQIHTSIKKKSGQERVTRLSPPIISDPFLRQICERQPESEYSDVYELFYYVIASSIYLPLTTPNSSKNNVEKVSTTHELYCALYLDIPALAQNRQVINLYDCLNEYTRPEWIDGYYHEAKNITARVAKQLIFETLPRILIICLKRLQYSPEKNKFCKVTAQIDFPMELSMRAYTTARASAYYSRTRPMQYQLYGVGNHHGNSRGLGGHYTSFIKNANMLWYEYDDEKVRQIQPTQVVSPAAYCLFYRRTF
jgi:ubiquitin C-terminal hydrolase